MAFDPKVHEVKQILIKCGRALREAKGLPEENNITILYNEASMALGVPLIETTTLDSDHLPSPREMMNPNGLPVIPLQKCPKCGKDSMEIFGLCPTCEDAKGENGEPAKYKTKFVCKECSYSERSEKHMVIWLQEMGVDFGNQSKKELGIKTITNEGIK
jgi:hypothetical protein